MRVWRIIPLAALAAVHLVSGHPLEHTSPNDHNLRGLKDNGNRAMCETPKCGETAGSSDARTIGYLRGSSFQETACENVASGFFTQGLTHINYAFAVVGEDYRIAATSNVDVDCYIQIHEFKARTQGLKIFISLRVLAAEGKLWRDMTRTATGRTRFVNSVLSFMDTFAFDGIDLYFEDVETPKLEAHTQGIEDTVALLKELKAALRATGQISLAFPASLEYLQRSRATDFSPYVDWFNLMNPGFHRNPAVGRDDYDGKLLLHSNMTEMASVLDHMAQSGIQPHQLVMGLTLYGRASGIKEPQCTDIGCPAKDLEFTESAGHLSSAGIWSQAMIESKLNETGVELKLAREVGVKYAYWDDTWVSFDDEETWEYKKRFANGHCLLGTAIWAMDLQSPDDWNPSLLTIAQKHSFILNQPKWAKRFFRLKVSHHIRTQNNAPVSILLTDCAQYPECPAGYYEIGSAHGTWSQFDVFAQGCDITPRRNRHSQRRAMCLPDSVATHGCRWVGQPPFCGAGCPKGSVEMALNNGPSGSAPVQLCHPYHWSAFCCEKVTLTDQPQLCDSFDMGSLLVQGLGPAGLGAAGAASREAVRMAQILGSGRRVDTGDDGIMESFDVCKKVFDRRLEQSQRDMEGK